MKLLFDNYDSLTLSCDRHGNSKANKTMFQFTSTTHETLLHFDAIN